MVFRVGRKAGRIVIAGLVAGAVAPPSSAFLFWTQPKLQGEKVRGDEPGIAIPLVGATPKEISGNLIWSMRAGLNVAALQCQFAPGLLTVDNYNKLIKLHSKELKASYDTVSAYFKRTKGPRWQTLFDQYGTQVYNGFSTLHAQLEFCETAASIGRDAQRVPDGKLVELAQLRMREFRNSLTAQGDAALAFRATPLDMAAPDIGCFDRKGRQAPCKN